MQLTSHRQAPTSCGCSYWTQDQQETHLHRTRVPRFARPQRRTQHTARCTRIARNCVARGASRDEPDLVPDRTKSDKESSTGSSSSSGKSGADATEQEGGSDDVDVLLDGIWRSFKKDLARDMPAGQAESLDQFSLEDALSGDTVMRKMAEDNFGPLLASMGVEEDPLTFFIDLVKVATCVQLITCAVVFYGAELGLHLDAGAALRATAGLGLGYFSRIFIKIERLVWPAYNWLLKLLVANAVYEVEATSAEDQQRTLNTLGVLVAVSFLVPQYALGWEPSDCLQLVWPLLLGLFGFDLTYMLALMLKLRLI